MDKLTIQGIKISTIIGVYRWEQKIPQNIYLDTTFETNAKRIAEDDNIHEAIDYDKVVSHVVAYTQNNHFKLIETLAENIAQELLIHFPTQWVGITLHKPAALKTAKDVTITIERSKS